jgi:hypothetical protein
MKHFIAALTIALGLTSPALAQDKPLALHPDNPHYLLFRNKPTILITSGEHYGAVLNLDFDYIKYLDELASKTLNLTRTFSGTYREIPGSFGITDNTLAPTRYLAPWARSATPGASDGGNKFDLSKWDDAYFARLKDFVSNASKRGIVVEYVLFCPFYEENLWAANPMNPKNNVNNTPAIPRTEVYTLKHEAYLAIHQAFVRKAVAELNGFDNVYFEICNEPYFGGITLEWQARIAQTIADTEKDLPNKHLIAQNIANNGAKIDKPNPLVSIFNFHYAQPPETVADNYNLNKVLGDDETGFRGKDDVLYRSEAWDFLIAGGATYSNLDYSFTPAHPSGDLRDYKSPGGGSPELRTQLKILKDFLYGFDFIRMKPLNGAVKGGSMTVGVGGSANKARTAHATVRCLAEPGKAYAIYVLGGTQAELAIDLPAGSYSAEWINTKTGQIEKPETFQHGGGDKLLKSPNYTQDIALRIRAK